METKADVLPRVVLCRQVTDGCHLHLRERVSPMKNRKREICTSGSVRDEDGQPPHLLGRRQLPRFWNADYEGLAANRAAIVRGRRARQPAPLRRPFNLTEPRPPGLVGRRPDLRAARPWQRGHAWSHLPYTSPSGGGLWPPSRLPFQLESRPIRL